MVGNVSIGMQSVKICEYGTMRTSVYTSGAKFMFRNFLTLWKPEWWYSIEFALLQKDILSSIRQFVLYTENRAKEYVKSAINPKTPRKRAFGVDSPAVVLIAGDSQFLLLSANFATNLP